MKLTCKSIVFLFLLGTLLEIGVFAEKLEENEKLLVIKKELKESQEKLKQTKEQQQQVLGKLVVITQELKNANRKLSLAKGKIQENTSKIGALSIELTRAEEDLQEKGSILKRRVRETYKNGGVNYLNLLLDSQSMSDFLSRLYYFEKIISRDAGLILDVKEDLQVTNTKRKVLTDRTQEIKELAKVISDQKLQIAQAAEEKKKALEGLKEREAEFKSKIAELQHSSQELEILIQKKIAERAKAGGAVVRGSGILTWPVNGRLTLGYHALHRLQGRHTGIDIAAPHGTPIGAADAGEVIFAGWWDGYGKAVVIDHGRGLATVYAHQSRIYVAVGNAVSKGQTIGLIGSTGYSTGPHLHFEVRKNGVVQNPMKYLK